MITIEQLKDVKERTEALYRYLDIEGKKIQVEEEQLRTQAPGFWDDQKAAEAQMKKVKGLQQWIAGYNEIKTLSEELQLAFDFYKDELVTEEEIDEAYAKEKGLEYKDMADLLQHPKVQALFRARIDTLQQQFAHYEQVKRFTLLPEPFSMERGELTNTLKLKRSVVATNYKELIDKMYEE